MAAGCGDVCVYGFALLAARLGLFEAEHSALSSSASGQRRREKWKLMHKLAWCMMYGELLVGGY